MSDPEPTKTETKPEVAPGKELVKACPLCGKPFVSPCALDTWLPCPQHGGCGQTFIVSLK